MNVLDSFSLQGKVAVVTGGFGRYGKQIVTALAQAGARTFTTTRDSAKIPIMENAFLEEGVSVKVGFLDLGNEDSVLQFRDQVIRSANHIDVLVNNAVQFPMKDWTDPVRLFEQSMQVNATGIFAVTRAFGDLMEERGKGSIINIASIHGMGGPDGALYADLDFHGFLPDYFFHKGGLINFTKFAASYYGGKGVRCNCISPGGFQTDAHAEQFVARYSARTMLGRMANRTDLMGAVVFLASDASSYVTAANIPVDGGYSAK